MNEKAVLVDQAARQASPRHYYPNNLLIRIPTMPRASARSKSSRKSSAQLRNIFQQMTWDQAQSPWTLRLGDKVVLKAPRTTILRTAFVTHAAHHRAQLGVYLRMLETPVPWSYGRSADEEPPAI